MYWFSSDFHFGHKNILTLGQGRPFKTIEEHDETIIKNWNDLVSKDDICWFLGDFAFGPDPLKYLDRLNGQFNIVWGNHDKTLKNEYYRIYNRDYRCTKINSAQDYKELKVDCGPETPSKIVLCHYPMRAWNKCRHGSIMLFGHEHGNMKPYGTSFDVGVDCWDFRPISLTEVLHKVFLLKEAGIKGGEHHGLRDY